MVNTNRAILYLKIDFWPGVGCFATTPSMFGQFLVHASAMATKETL